MGRSVLPEDTPQSFHLAEQEIKEMGNTCTLLGTGAQTLEKPRAQVKVFQPAL